MRLLVLFLTLLVNQDIGAATIIFEYTGEYARIPASSDGIPGWEVEDEELDTTASALKLSLDFGEKWYQQIDIETHSTSGLVPSKYGKSNDKSISLDKIAVIWGISKGWLPGIRIESNNYLTDGIVEVENQVFRDGVPIEVGGRLLLRYPGSEMDLHEKGLYKYYTPANWFD